MYISKYSDYLHARPWYHGKSGYVVIFNIIKVKPKFASVYFFLMKVYQSVIMFFADHLLNIVLAKDSCSESEEITAPFAFI